MVGVSPEHRYCRIFADGSSHVLHPRASQRIEAEPAVHGTERDGFARVLDEETRRPEREHERDSRQHDLGPVTRHALRCIPH